MTLGSDDIRIKISVDDDSARGTKSVAQNLSSVEQAASLAEKAALALGAAVAGLKLVDTATNSALAAARFETLGVVMETVGKNAGYSATEMRSYSKALQDAGISQTTSRETVTRLVQAHIDLTRSTELARIAQDAAVIGNINSSEAFERLIHGVQSAQVEVLRNIGINVNFEDSYKRIAKELGKTTAELSETEKAQARVNIVLEAGKDIAGTYEAAMGTAGKKLTSFTRYVEDLQVEIGKAFLPAFGQAVDDATSGIKEFTEYIKDPETQRVLKDTADGLFAIAKAATAIGVAAAKAGAVSFPNLIAEYMEYDRAAGKFIQSVKDAAAGRIDPNTGLPIGFPTDLEMARGSADLTKYPTYRGAEKIPVQPNIRSGDSGESPKSDEKLLKQYNNELQALRDKLLSEEDLIFESAVRREETYLQSLERKQISEDEYRRLSHENESAYDSLLQDLKDEAKNKQDEKDQQNLESFTQYLYGEEEAVWASYERRFDMLVRFEEAGLITKEQFYNYEEKLKRKTESQLTKIEKDAFFDREKWEKLWLKNKVLFTFAAINEITAGVAQSNETLFYINKGAKMAEATMLLAAGVSRTYNEYPYPKNLIFAGLHAALGATYIAQIASTQWHADSYTGGGSVSSFGGGTAASPTVTVPVMDTPTLNTPRYFEPESERQFAPVINITIEGSVNSSDDAYVRDVLIPSISKAVRDGVQM